MTSHSNSPHPLVSRRLLATYAAVVLSTSLAACASGSAETTDSSAAATAKAAAAVTVPEYDGPELSVPEGFDKPAKQDGYTFTIGFPVPSKAVPTIAAELEGAETAAAEYGGEVISLDAGFSVQKQISDFQQLLDQDVDAIVLSALDPSSLAPLLAKAAEKNVPVIVNDVPERAGADTSSTGFTASVLSGTDQASYATAKAVAAAAPGAAYGLLGLSIPSPFLAYISETQKTWADTFGLAFEAQVDATEDTLEAGIEKGAALLAANPDIEVIFAATDSLALGALSAVNNTDRDVKVVGLGGYSAAVESIKQGGLFATYGVNSTGLGEQWVYAAYTKLTDPEAELPAQVIVPGNKLLIKDDTDGFTPIG